MIWYEVFGTNRAWLVSVDFAVEIVREKRRSMMVCAVLKVGLLWVWVHKY